MQDFVAEDHLARFVVSLVWDDNRLRRDHRKLGERVGSAAIRSRHVTVQPRQIGGAGHAAAMPSSLVAMIAVALARRAHGCGA